MIIDPCINAKLNINNFEQKNWYKENSLFNFEGCRPSPHSPRPKILCRLGP